MGDFSFSFKKPPQNKSQAPKPQFEAAEAQFNAIRGCGINPKPKVTLATLTAGQDDATFAGDPFRYMLCLMGGTNEEGEPLSDDVWLFNPVCIAEEGHYSYVISNFMRITKGALPLEGLADTLDAENGQATVTFTVDGEPVEMTVEVGDGSVDGSVITAMVAIASQHGEGAQLAWTDVDGQWLLVFLNEQELGELTEATGLAWQWLE